MFHGDVTDSSGAVVPNARIVVVNTQTGLTREAISKDDGSYSVLALPPGNYDLSASVSGFKTISQQGIELLVNKPQRVNFTLSVGEVAETVTITGQPAQLQTANATLGTVIENRKIVDLPLNGRQFTQLILLAPGASPITTDQSQVFTPTVGAGGSSPSVNGQRDRNNSYIIDGVETADPMFNFTAISPTIDAIQEFNVQTNMTSAEYGRSGGANISVATKSGTNEFHASAWEFFRHASLGARNFFLPPTTPKPIFRQNQFGFTAGGPVILPKYDGRNRTFFFGYYEGFRLPSSQVIQATQPTAEQLDGNLASLVQEQTGTDSLGRPILRGGIYDPLTTRPDPANPNQLIRDPFPNYVIPTARLHPATVAYAKQMWPLANVPGAVSPNYRAAEMARTEQDIWSVRGDHNRGGKDNIFGRFTRAITEFSQPTSSPVVRFTVPNRMMNAAVGWTRIFSPAVLSDLRLGYTRTISGRFWGPPVGEDYLREYNLLDAFPPFKPEFAFLEMGVAGFSGAPNSRTPMGPNNVYSLSESVSWNKRSHTFKFGYSILLQRTLAAEFENRMGFGPEPTGLPGVSTSGQGLATFLLGLPSSAVRSVGSPAGDQYGWQHGLFVQDDIRLGRRLTLNLGLRYDYVPPQIDRYDHQATIDFRTGEFLVPARNPLTGAPANVRRGIAEPDRNNFAPRFGFAQLLSDKMTLRGGYGVFYDFSGNVTQFSQGVRANWPWALSQRPSGLNVDYPNAPLENPFPPSSPERPEGLGGTALDRFVRTPYSQQWHVTFERQLSPTLLARAAYIGSKGTKLVVQMPWNVPLPGPGSQQPRRPQPEYSFYWLMAGWGKSNYNGFQVELNKRLSHGLSFLLSYMVSKSIDVGSNYFVNSIQNPYNFFADMRAVSDFDLPQIFNFSYVYELPFGKGKRWATSGPLNVVVGGWELSGILSLRSGTPFSVLAGTDTANTGTGVRADVVGNPLPDGFNRSIDQWFDTAAFAVPQAYTFGNSGRNILRGPGYVNWDAGVLRRFSLPGEGRMVQFRAEFFNFTNTTHFGNPAASLASRDFGKILSASSPRVIQFALKLVY